MDQIHTLTEMELHQLIPLMGPRKRFTDYIARTRTTTAATTTIPTTTTTTTTSPTSTSPTSPFSMSPSSELLIRPTFSSMKWMVEIGRGGHGAVFMCEWRSEIVAVKVMYCGNSIEANMCINEANKLKEIA